MSPHYHAIVIFHYTYNTFIILTSRELLIKPSMVWGIYVYYSSTYICYDITQRNKVSDLFKL